MSIRRINAATARKRCERRVRGASRRSRFRLHVRCIGLHAVIAALALVCVAADATAQVTSTWAERERARIAGILIHTDVTAEITDTRLEEAIEQIGESLGVSIVGRFDHPRFGLGLDPDLPITISVEQIPAYVFIERLLALAEDEEPMTWQIRAGYVELGTKERLSVSAAREVRTYYIGDLLRVEDGFALGPYHSRIREVQLELATELFETILLTVEPEAWEPQPARIAPGRGEGDEVRTVPHRRPNDTRTPRRHTANLHVSGKWASMRFMNWDRLVINAPDFIHRQINGYPKAIRPEKDEPAVNDEVDKRAPVNADEKPAGEKPESAAAGGD